MPCHRAGRVELPHEETNRSSQGAHRTLIAMDLTLLPLCGDQAGRPGASTAGVRPAPVLPSACFHKARASGAGTRSAARGSLQVVVCFVAGRHWRRSQLFRLRTGQTSSNSALVASCSQQGRIASSRRHWRPVQPHSSLFVTLFLRLGSCSVRLSAPAPRIACVPCSDHSDGFLKSWDGCLRTPPQLLGSARAASRTPNSAEVNEQLLEPAGTGSQLWGWCWCLCQCLITQHRIPAPETRAPTCGGGGGCLESHPTCCLVSAEHLFTQLYALWRSANTKVLVVAQRVDSLLETVRHGGDAKSRVAAAHQLAAMLEEAEEAFKAAIGDAPARPAQRPHHPVGELLATVRQGEVLATALQVRDRASGNFSSKLDRSTGNGTPAAIAAKICRLQNGTCRHGNRRLQGLPC